MIPSIISAQSMDASLRFFRSSYSLLHKGVKSSATHFRHVNERQYRTVNDDVGFDKQEGDAEVCRRASGMSVTEFQQAIPFHPTKALFRSMVFDGAIRSIFLPTLKMDMCQFVKQPIIEGRDGGSFGSQT